jgi:hypothetical protein
MTPGIASTMGEYGIPKVEDTRTESEKWADDWARKNS